MSYSDGEGNEIPMPVLSAEEMLGQIHWHGQDAGSDFNDGMDNPGWFGWTIDGDVLTATYQPCDDDGAAGPVQTFSWRLEAQR